MFLQVQRQAKQLRLALPILGQAEAGAQAAEQMFQYKTKATTQQHLNLFFKGVISGTI